MVPRNTARQPRQPVLVVLHSDGFVQVYGDKSTVDAHIVIMPLQTTNEGQIWAEKYVDMYLPKRHSDVFWPSNLIGTHQVRTVTSSDLADREHNLRLCNVLSSIGQDTKGRG